MAVQYLASPSLGSDADKRPKTNPYRSRDRRYHVKNRQAFRT